MSLVVGPNHIDEEIIRDHDDIIGLSKEDFKKSEITTTKIFKQTINTERKEIQEDQKNNSEKPDDPFDKIDFVLLNPDEDDDSKKEYWIYAQRQDNKGDKYNKPLGYIVWKTNIENMITSYIKEELFLHFHEVEATINGNKLQFDVIKNVFEVPQRNDREKDDMKEILKGLTTDNKNKEKGEEVRDKTKLKKTNRKNIEKNIYKEAIVDNLIHRSAVLEDIREGYKKELEKKIKTAEKTAEKKDNTIESEMYKILLESIKNEQGNMDKIPNEVDILFQKNWEIYDLINLWSTIDNTFNTIEERLEEKYKVQQKSMNLWTIMKDFTTSASSFDNFIQTGNLPSEFLQVNTISQSEELKKLTRNIVIKRAIINGNLRKINGNTLMDKDQQDFQEYLQQVLNNKIDPAKDPFIALAAAQDQYDEVMTANPALQQYLNTNTTNNNNNANNSGNTNNAQGTQVPSFEWWVNAWKSWVDKMNVLWVWARALWESLWWNEWQIQRAEKVWWLLSAAWAAVLAFKWAQGIYRLIFSDDEKKKEAGMKWLWAALAVFWWTYIATWDPLDRKAAANKIVDMRKKWVDWLWFGGKSFDTIKTNLTVSDTLFSGLTYKTLKEYISKDSNGKMKLDIDKYKNAVNSWVIPFEDNNWNPDLIQKQRALEIIEKVKNDPTFIDDTFKTIGITYEYIDDNNNKDKRVKEEMANGLFRINTVSDYLKTGFVGNTNPDNLKAGPLKVADGDENKKKFNEVLQNTELKDPLKMKEKLDQLNKEWVLIPA